MMMMGIFFSKAGKKDLQGLGWLKACSKNYLRVVAREIYLKYSWAVIRCGSEGAVLWVTLGA